MELDEDDLLDAPSSLQLVSPNGVDEDMPSLAAPVLTLDEPAEAPRESSTDAADEVAVDPMEDRTFSPDLSSSSDGDSLPDELPGEPTEEELQNVAAELVTTALQEAVFSEIPAAREEVYQTVAAHLVSSAVDSAVSRVEAEHRFVADEIVNQTLVNAVDQILTAQGQQVPVHNGDADLIDLMSMEAEDEPAASQLNKAQTPDEPRPLFVSTPQVPEMSPPSSPILSSSGSEASLLSTSSGDRLEDLEIVRDTGSDTDALLNYYKVTRNA